MIARTLFPSILLAALTMTPALAQDAPAGVTACKACHGLNGVSISPLIPNVAGQKAPYIENQLKAFKNGDRKNDLMHAIASQLSPEDIKAYAAFWSSLPAMPTADVHTGAAPTTAPAIPSRMTLPANFPAGFIQYQDLPPEDGNGPTKRYANAIAIKAIKVGKPLPNGSVIVTETHSADGAVASYAAMESRAGWGEAIPMLLRNGDWDYALMGPDKKNRPLNQAQCLACHKPVESDSYIFTMTALKAAAAKH